MAVEQEPLTQADRHRTRESELLAEVESFRKELYSIVPFGLLNPIYRGMVRCLVTAARRIEVALRYPDKTGVPPNDFESRQKQTLLESSERNFNELRRFRTEIRSLVASYMADHRAPVAGTTRNRS
jgi:hypothetical protein